jgi:hypothetical protein
MGQTFFCLGSDNQRKIRTNHAQPLSGFKKCAAAAGRLAGRPLPFQRKGYNGTSLMKAGSLAILASGFLLAATTDATAQAQAPTLPPAPVSLSVPNPISPAPISLSVPNPIPPPRGPRDLYQNPDRSDRFQQLPPPQQMPSPPIVFVPGYVYGTYPYYVAPDRSVDVSQTRTYRRTIGHGGLWLETAPETAQVYVDGFYVGIVQDYGVRGRMLELSAGPHRIELRAAGYQTLVFDVTIEPGQIVRYRGDLQPLTPPAQAPSTSPPAPKPVYVIPNCYAGDKPPMGALRVGCDVKKMRVRKAEGRQ